MAFFTRALQQEVLSWPSVSMRPHQFAAKEFRFNGKAEIGHLHLWGTLDIPFPRTIHDALLEANQAEQHRWVPESGWVTFHIRTDADVEHGVWLMRLSYVRYALKTVADPDEFLKRESDELRLSSKLASLLAAFMPSKAA